MNRLSIKGLACGLVTVLCFSLLGCDDPDMRLQGLWDLSEYKDGFRTENETSHLTIITEDRFVLDSPGNLFGIVDFRYTVEGTYQTDRSAKPALITLQYNIMGVDITNIGIYQFEGPFWDRTLFLALNYEAGEDAELRLSKTSGPVLVGQHVPDSKVVLPGMKGWDAYLQCRK